MYNYHSNTPYIALTNEYPTAAERRRFLEAYVAHGRDTADKEESLVTQLESEIRDWRVVNHAFWCTWGVVMSEDDPELVANNGDMDMEDEVIREERPIDEDQGASASDFDYIAYADQKMRLFWGELASGKAPDFDDYKDVLGMDACKIISD